MFISPSYNNLHELATILLGLIKLHRGTCILERRTAPYSENSFKQELSRLAREARYYKSVIMHKYKQTKGMFKAPPNKDHKLGIKNLDAQNGSRHAIVNVGRTRTQVLRHENRQLRVKLDQAIQQIENLNEVSQNVRFLKFLDFF